MTTTAPTTMDNDDLLTKLLASVELTQPQAAPEDELPAQVRERVQSASQRAYYQARAAGQSLADAKAAAKAAFDVEVSTILGELRGAKAAPATVVQATGPAPEPVRTPVQAPPAPPPAPPSTPRQPPPPVLPNISAGDIYAAGAERSRADAEAMRRAGFSPAEPYYERGSRVNSTGVENARRSRVEHEKKPLVTESTAELVDVIRAENRRILIVEAGKLGMNEQGRLTCASTQLQGTKEPGPAIALPMTMAAFRGLTTSLGYGGANYLARCPVRQRARDFEDWRRVISNEDPAARAEAIEIATAIAESQGQEPSRFVARAVPKSDARIALRVRDKRDGNAEVFAAVSPSYSPFDSDIIADAIRRACSSTREITGTVGGSEIKADLSQARGRTSYDGTKARFEVMFHSNVQPQHYVAGEFFKAGVLVRTDDTGGGACKLHAVVWQNLCLNLLCIDRCGRELATIRHVGDVFSLTKKFEAAFGKALKSLEHFLRAWGYACEDEVLVSTRRAAPDQDIPQSIDKALPGLFNGILEAGLVAVRGRRDTIINKLVECWEADDSGAKLKGLTRASLVNAFTRLAHTMSFDDPWAEDEIQRDAGKLLWGRGDRSPAPIPYLSLEEIVESEAPAAALLS